MTWNIVAYLWIRVQTRSEQPGIVYTISIYSIWQWMWWTKITKWIIETTMSTVHPENTLRWHLSDESSATQWEMSVRQWETVSTIVYISTGTMRLALMRTTHRLQWYDLTWWKKSSHRESGRRVWHRNQWRWRDLNTNKTNLLLVPQHEIIH